MRPMIDCTQRTRRTDTPPRPSRSPAKMKNGTASSAYLSRLENITWCAAVAGTPAKNTSAIATVASSTRKNGKPATSSATGTSAITQPMRGASGLSGQVKAQTQQHRNRGEREANEQRGMRDPFRHACRDADRAALIEERHHLPGLDHHE